MTLSTTVIAGGFALVLLAAGCGGQANHPPSPTPAPTTPVTTITSADRLVITPRAPPAPRLVFVYALQPRNQLFQTLTVDTNGGGSVGYFIGETAGVRHSYFRLGAAAVARLRRELDGLGGLRPESLGGPTTLVYTIIAHGRSVRVTQRRIPRRIRMLVANLSGLISRYEP